MAFLQELATKLGLVWQEKRNLVYPEVVERLNKVLPKKKVKEIFTSSPEQTGGQSIFPYCRVDTSLVYTRNILISIEDGNLNFDKMYPLASQLMLKAILWIEIGWQGIDNYADSSTVSNWTTDIGHTRVSHEKRVRYIKNEGRDLYLKTISRFIAFREERGVERDCFSQNKLDYLLDKFRD